VLAIAVGVSLWAAGPALALIVGGGGSSRTDCLLVFDAPVNDPPSKPKRIRCTDGDPGCDADGVVNGECVFPVSVCGNSTFDPRCTLSAISSIRVDHAVDDGQDPKFDVDFLALQNRINSQIELGAPPTFDQCTSPTNIRVRVSGPFPGGVCKRVVKQIKIVTLSTFQMGKRLKDTDKLKLTCDPPVPCAPQALFAGTYDRIQRQVFNPSCALGGCHDSQSQAGGMLLEPAGSFANIVDVQPANLVAAGLGWRRIDAANATPDSSFLYRKVTGDLPDPLLGIRMPYKRRKLDAFLIDILRLWIEAGAPQAGWVPGTD
jgi:hypothetical protein